MAVDECRHAPNSARLGSALGGGLVAAGMCWGLFVWLHPSAYTVAIWLVTNAAIEGWKHPGSGRYWTRGR